MDVEERKNRGESWKDTKDKKTGRRVTARVEKRVSELEADAAMERAHITTDADELAKIEGEVHRHLSHMEDMDRRLVELEGDASPDWLDEAPGLKAPSARDRKFIERFDGLDDVGRSKNKARVAETFKDEPVSEASIEALKMASRWRSSRPSAPASPRSRASARPSSTPIVWKPAMDGAR